MATLVTGTPSWQPKYDFDFRSDLAREIGIKGYHDKVFAGGAYPVAG
jgi:UDP-glucose 4-epimerase